MKKINKISVKQCCIHYSIEKSFVQQLDDYGLIQLSRTEEKTFIDFEQLSDLEKYIHLHYDLEINMAGLDTIRHLLNRMQQLQSEVKRLQNEL